jgi:DNA-binding MarR family transcriptional regulator
MAEERWLDEREERGWRALKAMHDRLTAALSRDLAAASPLSYADYEVLVTLTDQPDGRLRPFQLVDALGWEQSRLSHHIRRMVTRGLVEKVPCEDDHRGSFVAVTAAGRRAIKAAAPRHVDTVRRLFIDQISPRQLATITAAAERVLAALDDE